MPESEQIIIEFIPDTTQLDKTLNEISKGITDELGKAGGGKDFLKGVAQGIAEETKEVEKLKKSVDNLTKSEVTANKEIDKFSKSMNNLAQGIAGGAIKQGTDNITKIGNAATKTATEATKLTTQLRAMREQLSRLDEGSDEFIKLSIEAGKLQDRIGDVSQRIRALSSDTFAIDAVVDSARAVAGAFSIAQGAAALFGDENQDLQKALLKVQASLAVLNGLQEVSNFVTGQSAGKIAIVTAAQKVYAFVTNASTLATRAFNLALVGLGAGAVIAAVTYLITKMDLLGTATKETGKDADATKEKFKELQEVADNYLRGYAKTLTDIDVIRRRIETGIPLGSDEEVKIIEQLQEVSTNYFGALKAGESTFKDIADAVDRYQKAIVLSSQLEAARKNIEPYRLELLKLKEQANDATGSISVDYGRLNKLSFTVIPELTEEIAKLEEQINALGGDPSTNIKKVAKEIVKASNEIKKALKFTAGDSENNLDTQVEKSIGLVGDLQAKLSKLNEAIPTAKTVEELNQIRLAIALTQQELDKLLNPTVTPIEDTPQVDYITLEKEKQDLIRETAIEGARQTFDAIFAISSENRSRELSADLEALDKKRQAELSNKELTDSQRAAIDKKYAAQERQLRIKAFNAEKQAKIAAAFINGALAITNILATVPPVIPGTIIPNPQYAASLALAGITTALQIATISAQKPPAFKKGTKGAKQSAMSIVGEEGAELMYVPQGAKIVPHSETMKVLSGHPDTNEILSRFNIPVSSPKINTLKKEFNGYDFSRLEKAISKNNARFPQVNMDKNGIVTIVNEENSSRTYYGQRYSSR